MAEFDRLSTQEGILKWFKSYFPDALAAIGEEKLLQDFTQNPRSPLISIKVGGFPLNLAVKPSVTVEKL
jgi:kynurenine 3-monooxygenase